MEGKFLYLDREAVKKYLRPEDVINAVKGLWSHWKDGSVREGDHAFLPAGDETGNEFLHIGACLNMEGILGFKWINIYRNPAPGYPFSHGNIVVVNDIRTGALRAIVSADDITAMRTAGGHGVVSARYLAKDKVRTLSVIGSGSQAVQGIRGFLTEFKELECIRVNCRRKERFQEIREMFGDKVPLVHMEDIREAVRNADVILTATNSKDILLRCDDIEKGTTVIALDGFIDVDPELSRRADKWFVGNLDTDRKEIVDSKEMSHGFELRHEDIIGEVADVITGRLSGRESDDEIIVCTHMGSGTYDVACAFEVYKKALEAGDGLELRL